MGRSCSASISRAVGHRDVLEAGEEQEKTHVFNRTTSTFKLCLCFQLQDRSQALL